MFEVIGYLFSQERGNNERAVLHGYHGEDQMSGKEAWHRPVFEQPRGDVARQLIERGSSCSVTVDFRNYDSSSPLVIFRTKKKKTA